MVFHNSKLFWKISNYIVAFNSPLSFKKNMVCMHFVFFFPCKKQSLSCHVSRLPFEFEILEEIAIFNNEFQCNISYSMAIRVSFPYLILLVCHTSILISGIAENSL